MDPTTTLTYANINRLSMISFKFTGNTWRNPISHDPEHNFDVFWETFHQRYPFFEIRNTDWDEQYRLFRPKVTKDTSDDELFDILCQMIDPLNDGHVELKSKAKKGKKKRSFTPEPTPRFLKEFSDDQVEQLFQTSEKTLMANGFGPVKETQAWMLHYCRSQSIGYLRILELEDIKRRKLIAALDKISEDFQDLDGFIIDIRDNPGGDDDTVLDILNRFCDRKRVAFHRKTKIGPDDDEFSNLKTWNMKPKGKTQFTRPIVLLTGDSVFSGGEIFALAAKQLPYVTSIGDHTNGIFSYQLEKKLPNGWRYCLSYQMYFSADMVCYEGKGVPVDIELHNKVADIDKGVDPLIIRALEVLKSA